MDLTRLAEAAEAMADAIADGGAKSAPPVQLWNPTRCADIGMLIRRDGTWWSGGSRIVREDLVRLFSRILRKDDDGLHYLVTPHEKVIVVVETAPFLAVRVDAIGNGPDRALRFTTNVGDQVDAGPDRPIRVETDPATGEPEPFVLVRGRLEALLTRPVFFDLVDLAEEEGDRLVARSRGIPFSLGLVQEPAR